MILFSTLTQPLVLILFCYLGFNSGLIFYLISDLCSFLYKKKLLNQNLTNKKQVLNHKKNEKNQNNKRKKVKKFNKENLKKFFSFFSKYFTIYIKIFIFILVICISYFVNLKLNYGEINLVCICFFIIMFFVARYFLNLLAKSALNFYNKYIKRAKNNE